jgi:hypothetical protein
MVVDILISFAGLGRLGVDFIARDMAVIMIDVEVVPNYYRDAITA